MSAHRSPLEAPRQPDGLLIANLLTQLAFGLFVMTLCLPSMQEWGAIFGGTQTEVQLTFSGFMVAYGVFQLVHGPLSDRYGRKPVLMIGLVIAAVGSALAALAPTLATLTAARVLQGAGGAAGVVVGRAMVQDLFDGPQRTRIMAYMGMVMGLVPPFATLVGGQIHVRLGWEANFVLAAVAAVVCLAAAWRGLPSLAPRVERDVHWLRAMLGSYAQLARHTVFLLYVAVLSLTTGAFFVFLAGAPIVLGRYGVGPASLGWYIMCVPVTYMVGNYVTSRLVHRVGERSMMAFGQVLTLAGLALMLALGLAGVQTALAFALPLMLLGFGHGALMPHVLSGTVGVVPALAGSAAAVGGLTQQLTGALAGYVVGLVPHENAVNLGLLMITFTLGAVGAQALLHGRRR